MKEIYNGIYKITLGNPEEFTPVTLRKTSPCQEGLKNIGHGRSGTETTVNTAKYIAENFSEKQFKVTNRGCTIELPLTDNERLFGFGLQLKSFAQKNKKKTIRTNADPMADTGDSHAPVPFYVSTLGYGIFVDTARYVSFYCGQNKKKKPLNNNSSLSQMCQSEERLEQVDINESDLYKASENSSGIHMAIEIPVAKGVDIYIFEGPSLKEAVQRYNLFSGGGAMPPLWGLGIWYRAYTRANQSDALGFAKEFREKNLPCTVFGLEPGWLSKAYSTSFVWNKDNFPEHEEFIEQIKSLNYKLNLWEHIYVHPTAPFYDEIHPYSGDYEVWGGLVPDFNTKGACDIFSQYHDKELVSKGVSGFKLDECDSSDFTGGWAHPNCSEFPSGLDGEQMHSMMGLLYQELIGKIYDEKNIRTWSLVRQSHALASSYPFTLYSDLYDHKDYIRAMSNMAFSGLLWTPELRWACGVEDLVRRLQTVCFSPVAQIDAWCFPIPPWRQVNRDLNRLGVEHDDVPAVESLCRNILELRMKLVPYLYTAFRKYNVEGISPIRPLVMDYPDDPETYTIDNAVIIGDSLYYAPIVASMTSATPPPPDRHTKEERESTDAIVTREFYLPAGRWVNFFDPSQILDGLQKYTFDYDLNTFPLYVKAGTLMPLAKPCQYIDETTVLEIEPLFFKDPSAEDTVDLKNTQITAVLYEDDGFSIDYKKEIFNTVTITVDSDGKFELKREGSYNSEKYILRDIQA